ncbi:MAG: ABC-2 transporter permease [Clostridia bacterium]|nr:ABC-2 transporter permease [Clostridia bacterium]
MTGRSEKIKSKMGKLIKNDFLASARVIPFFYLVLIAAMGAFLIGSKTNNNKLLAIGMAVSTVVSILLIFVTFFFVVYDFYKSLFTQQGYLSFSLPVTSRQLLGSKMIVYGLWMILSYAVFLGVIWYMGNYLQDDVIGEETMNTADLFLTMFNLPTKSQIIIYAIYIIATFFILVLTFISMIYFSISASHMRAFQKANLAWAVVIFVALFIVMTLAINLLEKAFVINLIFYGDKNTPSIVFGYDNYAGTSFSLIPMIFFVVLNVVLFFLTADIMHKRINIK